ncbi:cation diffusion facilitator family transporter [Geobacillus stearothermophilus]|uniref:cation diffusion facilitator family transporter n=1 Tax=Geobacillus stearothermophilus TaxID=1422 RepID=UPI0025A5498F|nr:cation diffusion facilitator family transporter [Geobacillus stearothermophilus]MED4271777.1 cation diffusion facilitator family transporter [Geobacillus stearothermophilus]WJQ01700.1 cation diffusion facilitator family transporter [Geobacillus stearothermophilus]WJQ05106.1 cation diffusion facilitator family transporter [Geobacillus stearothermophilus]
MVNGVERKQRAEAGVLLSLFIYLLLAAGKLLAGAAAGSDGVKADGWNNLSDVMASVAVYIGMKIAKKPRDRNHPYGHSRAENISSLLAAFFMMSIGIDVITDGARTLLGGGREAAPDWLAAAAALASAAVMFIIYVINVRLARRTNSMALAAVAKDNLSDVLVSIGAALGIVGAHLEWAWLDPLAALVIGALICKTAWEVFMETAHALTDGFDERKLAIYRQEIAAVSGVRDVADIKARMLGNDVVLEVTIRVDSQLTVVKSHEIADEVERLMKKRHNIRATHVHVEPEAVR